MDKVGPMVSLFPASQQVNGSHDPNSMFGCQIIEGFGPRVSVACTGSPGVICNELWEQKIHPAQPLCGRFLHFERYKFVASILCRRLCLYEFCAGLGFRVFPSEEVPDPILPSRSSQRMFLDDVFNSHRDGFYWYLSNMCDHLTGTTEADNRPNCSKICMNSWTWEGIGSRKECHPNLQTDATATSNLVKRLCSFCSPHCNTIVPSQPQVFPEIDGLIFGCLNNLWRVVRCWSLVFFFSPIQGERQPRPAPPVGSKSENVVPEDFDFFEIAQEIGFRTKALNFGTGCLSTMPFKLLPGLIAEYE